MPSVASNTSDGHIAKSGTGTWSSVRDATDGDSVSNTGFGGSFDIGTQGKGVGTAGQYTVKRSFFQFNVSGVSNITELTMSVYGNASGGGNVRAVKPTAASFASGLGVEDFDAIEGFSAGNTMAGNVTDYSDTFFAIANSVTNEIFLNTAAVNDANASGKLSVCLVGDTFDYRNVDPSSAGNNTAAVAFAEFPVTSFQPILIYKTGSGARQAVAGTDFTREELRTRQNVTANIDAATDYEAETHNDIKSICYLNFEGGKGKRIFNSASLRRPINCNFITESNQMAAIVTGKGTRGGFSTMSGSLHKDGMISSLQGTFSASEGTFNNITSSEFGNNLSASFTIRDDNPGSTVTSIKIISQSTQFTTGDIITFRSQSLGATNNSGSDLVFNLKSQDIISNGTSSFLLSSSDAIPGNTFQVAATNLSILSGSTTTFKGINFELFEL